MSKPTKPSKKKGALLGVKISPSDYSLDKQTDVHMYFGLRVAKGTHADPLFYTSPRLRELINTHQLAENRTIGNLKYFGMLKPNSPRQVQVKTYPFDMLKGEQAYDRIMGKGIASEIEKKCLVEMKKRYGEDLIIKPWKWTEPPRVLSLEKRGIKVTKGDKPQYKSSVANMIRTINTTKRAWRAKNGKNPVRHK